MWVLAESSVKDIFLSKSSLIHSSGIKFVTTEQITSLLTFRSLELQYISRVWNCENNTVLQKLINTSILNIMHNCHPQPRITCQLPQTRLLIIKWCFPGLRLMLRKEKWLWSSLFLHRSHSFTIFIICHSAWAYNNAAKCLGQLTQTRRVATSCCHHYHDCDYVVTSFFCSTPKLAPGTVVSVPLYEVYTWLSRLTQHQWKSQSS